MIEPFCGPVYRGHVKFVDGSKGKEEVEARESQNAGEELDSWVKKKGTDGRGKREWNFGEWKEVVVNGR